MPRKSTVPLTTKANLVFALMNSSRLYSVGEDETLLMHQVNDVEREDGSNKSWMVSGYLHGIQTTIHVWTID